MKAKLIPVLILSFILSGCWDEQMMRDQTTVPVVGYEGSPGDITGYYVYPIFQQDKIDVTVVSGKGKSLQDARLEANTKVNQILNVTQLEAVLFTEDAAKHDMYDYLDPFYRFPRSRLTAYLAIVEGDMKEYLDENKKLPSDLSEFYIENLENAHKTSLVEETDLQDAVTLLFDPGIDLTLPYFQIDEESGNPKIEGSALFSNRKYTGTNLDHEESLLMNLMKNRKGKFARYAMIWERGDKNYQVTMDISKVKKKWKITENDGKVRMTGEYDFEVQINELAFSRALRKEEINELEKFISGKFEEEFKEVFGKLQDAKSDALGIGRTIRAFHSDIWGKGDWHDTYKEMEVEFKVKATIFTTGILR